MIGFLFLLEAVRTSLYLRFMHLCIGEYRGSRRLTMAAFFVLWAAESFLRSVSPMEQELMVMDLFFFMAEIPALFLLSFCYKGRFWRHVGMALFLPALYWTGKWTAAAVFFGGNAVPISRYLPVTAVTVFLFWLFTVILGKVKSSRDERERERLEEEVRMYERQFELIRQSQQAARALKHDMKHHVKMLVSLVSGGNREEALAYLSSMGAFMEPAEEYVSSGNEKIDSILNYMISRAKADGAAVDLTVHIPERLPVSAFDLNVILSNLLENAVQALKGAKEPVLSIVLQYDRNVLCIKIKNTCAKHQAPTQDARQREGHGFGLDNVRKAAEKYHGSLEITADSGWFLACVCLFL